MTERRGRSLRAVGADIDRVTGPIRKRRGFFEAGLFAEWPSIVGEELAAECAPLRVARGPEGVGGTLHIRVGGPLALELQHLEPQVVERINGYFGYRAIGALRFHQGPLPKREKPVTRPRPVPAPEDVATLQAQLAGVADDDLRAALDRLGRAVVARSRAARAHRSTDS